MKGASALPLARISNPPKTPRIISSGRSQNFLRARAKAHSSEMKLMQPIPSELVSNRAWIRTGRRALFPVAGRLWVVPQCEEFASSLPSENSEGGDYSEKDHTQDDGIDDSMQ